MIGITTHISGNQDGIIITLMGGTLHISWQALPYFLKRIAALKKQHQPKRPPQRKEMTP